MARQEERDVVSPTYGSPSLDGTRQSRCHSNGTYVIPRQDLHPLLHNPVNSLVTAAQYVLGSLQKAKIRALLPPLQGNPHLAGAAFL